MRLGSTGSESAGLERQEMRKQVKCLITGFDAFGPTGAVEANPTQSFVESLPRSLVLPAVGRVPLSGRVLPTASRGGWQALKRSIDEAVAASDGSLVLVMTGLSAGRSHISLERFAMNMRDYPIKDNEGNQFRDAFVDELQPDTMVRRTRVPLDAVESAVNEAGFPCQISNHAGTFLCNELYFKALDYCSRLGKVQSVLFVHVPHPETLAKAAGLGKVAASPSRSRDYLRRALLCVTKAALKESFSPQPFVGG